MLLDASRAGVQMDRIVTIGRQSLFLHPSELKKIREISPGALDEYKWGEYADRFLRESLRTKEIHALDYSSFEGADILHDLNLPIPDSLKARFDLVIEAGTLEHVFNFPVAIANVMQMAKVGGTLIGSTIANNLCGHGFYQFSPELIFRILTAENGFELDEVLVAEGRYPGVELTPLSAAFKLTDPAQIGDRVGVMSSRPLMMFFQAKRTADVAIFARTPLQSDYATAWDSMNTPDSRSPRAWRKFLPGYGLLRQWLDKSPMARPIRNRLTGRNQLRQFSLNNKRAFRRVS
jgi:hypothetical protein